jgi:pyruvate dehydrogenase E1 component
MVPFFFFYSMFGFQRIGDLIWASGDAQTRGFLLGATAGRTTLAGEGLQHQDGHSHILAYGNPSVLAYDPAFAYEVAVIVREGMRRMLEEGENIVYYLTITNEFYKMPAMPENVEEGILKGMYKFRASDNKRTKIKAHLFGSGTILNEALKAQALLENDYGVAADVWSVTSYKNLYWDASDTERWNFLHPDREPKLSSSWSTKKAFSSRPRIILKPCRARLPNGCPERRFCSAPTVMAAATHATVCVISSRWTLAILAMRPLAPWRVRSG